jgi:predicted transcriptional regulator
MNGTYKERNIQRETLLEESTMALVKHFMELGDTKTIADQKVSQLSTEVALYIYPYVLGNMTLVQQIEASELSFMDDAAKAVVNNILDYING